MLLMVRLGFDTVELEYLFGCVVGFSVILILLLVLIYDILVVVGIVVILYGIVMGFLKLILYVFCGMEIDDVFKVKWYIGNENKSKIVFLIE